MSPQSIAGGGKAAASPALQWLQTRMPGTRVVNAGLAWYFVLVWGGGFIATKIALQYTSPFVFLCIRFSLGLVFLLPLALVLKFRWPSTRAQWGHAVVAGLLLHATYLGGSHYAQFLGMSAGTAALILASQPLLTALIAGVWLGERLLSRQWLGIAIGLAGVTLVVWHKIDVHAIGHASLVAVGVSLFGTTLGTLYQRRFCPHIDLRAASVIQFAASLIVLAPLAITVEGIHVRWSWQLISCALFLVIGASILALNAFHLLMRRGQATRVASLLYLTPVVATLLEFAVFKTLPSVVSLAGMGVVCAGVALVAMHRSQGAPVAVPDS